MASHVSLLVTGSRNAIGRQALCDALDESLDPHSWDSLSLFVGCCTTGSDLFARDWWHARNPRATLTCPDSMVDLYTSVPEPSDFDDGFRERLYIYWADWRGAGRAAGPQRNARLVEAWHDDGGGHVAIAQWSGDVKGSGTLDTMSRVVKRGYYMQVIPC